MVKNYVRRGDWFHYQRRVPKRLAPYDSRKHIRISLKTKDEKEAQRAAAIYDDFIEQYWRGLIQSGEVDQGRTQFEEARLLAKAHGFLYKNVAEVAAAPLEERLARIEAVADNPRAKREALLGLPGRQGIKLSQCMERFWPLCADRFVGKSDHQILKYKNPRNAALKNFIKVVGDMAVAEVERGNVLQFRNWFLHRIEKRKISGDTANKQMRHVKDILHTIALDQQIERDFKLLFAETTVKKEMRSRSSFEASYVQNTFLGGDALVGLNEDARMLIYLMIETGARESEILGLLPEEFVFDEDVPHICIQPNKLRALKTKSSERRVPLVGVSLLAAERVAATGITRYRNNPDTASGSINKYLRENGLKPTPGHTLYSLRHTFKDRLRDAGAPEEVIDELMGHTTAGPKYGRGHMLETKFRWLQKIMLTVPDQL